MEKDASKLMSRTLLTYAIILSFVFIMKLFGLDYFGLDTENKIIVGINEFVLKFHLENIWYAFTLYLNGFIIMAITCNDNSKKMKKFVLYCLPLFIILQLLKSNINLPYLFVLIDLLYLFILSICYIMFINKDRLTQDNISNYWLYMGINLLYQMISLFVRNIKPDYYDNSFLLSFICNIDYILLTIMTYKLYFIKGGKSLT